MAYGKEPIPIDNGFSRFSETSFRVGEGYFPVRNGAELTGNYIFSAANGKFPLEIIQFP